MREIYSQARTVLVILGDCDDNGRLTNAFVMIRRVLHQYQVEVGRYYDRTMLSGEFTTVEQNKHRGFPSSDSPEWQDLGWFLDLPWFSRLWVFQEITLSRSSVAFIGEYEIMNLYLVGEAAPGNRKRYYLEPWRLEFNDAICAILAMDICKGLEGNERHSFSYLVHGTLECGITFPEDRIYSLLGIARESNHL
jgi:hypothetical protein